MVKEKQLAQDFGIFGNLSAEAEPEIEPTAEGEDPEIVTAENDIFGLGSEEPEKKEEIPEVDKEAPATTSDDSSTIDEENEIEKLIREAGEGLAEIKDDPTVSPEVSEKLQEALDLNDELAAKVDSLTRQLDVSREQTNKNLETGEEMRIYQPMITKLEKDPQLMMLAKHYGTKNDTMKDRLTDIVKDMLHELTGEDIYSLMNAATSSKATAFGETSEDAPPPALDQEKPKEEDNAYGRPKKNRMFPI